MSPYGNAMSGRNGGAGNPTTMSPARPEPREASQDPTARGEAESLILVVNDAPDLAELMRHQLSKSGYNVLTAADGLEGYEVAQAARPDLIITDVAMPRMTGIEMCRLIRAHTLLRTTPVLLVSGVHRDSKAAVEGFEAGADDYLVAPYDAARLVAKAARLMERRRAEEAQRASESEMRALFAAMTDVVMVLDGGGKYLKVAPTSPSNLYRPPADLVGKTLHQVFPKEQADFFLSHVRHALSEDQRHSVEYLLRVKGRDVWFDACISPLTRDSVLWIARDITERKQAEEALHGSEERYRLLFESNPQPMWVYDLETLRFLAVNEAAVQHYGYSREEFLAMTVKDIRPPGEVPALLELLARPASGLEKAGTWKHRRKDGSVINVEITSNQLTFASRRAELVLVNDVTERTKTETALRAAEEKYRGIFENAVEGIFQSTAEGKWISANPALAHMLGYESPRELMASVTDIEGQLYVEADSRSEYRRLLEEHGIVRGVVTQLRRKDGSGIWASVSARAIRNASGTLVCFEGSVEDITERKQLEEQLRQSQKMEAVGQLAGGVAHDFNNLLTVINGYSDLTLRRMPAEDPLRRNVEEVIKAGERAASLTRQLLAFSRKQVLRPKVLDLNQTVTEMEKMLRRLIGEDVELRASLGPGLGSVKADPGQIEQVLMNLAINARDAMPHGGKLTIGTENVHLGEEYASQHIAVKPGPYVMLAVSDTGVGMDERTRARIFEPFFTTKGAGKGTGLGLSTVYGIVKQSGGNIWVYSEVGRGTTFKIYLPRVDEGAQADEPSAVAEEGLEGTETILLAEDEQVVRDLAREVLEMYGYRVLVAADGDAALSTCERHAGPIHLLVTDVVMPTAGGPELSRRLRQSRPEMRVLFMSGYTDDAIVHHGVLDDGVNFIQKPFEPEALARKVREVLGQN
jgi:two-component system cell cycle sensor histidine kinase/response regulator CckA